MTQESEQMLEHLRPLLEGLSPEQIAAVEKIVLTTLDTVLTTLNTIAPRPDPVWQPKLRPYPGVVIDHTFSGDGSPDPTYCSCGRTITEHLRY